MFKPALNITEQIADYVEEKIVSGELAEGARVQEIKLAKALEVSRGSIREALLILERRRLIEVIPRKGAVVNAVSAEDAQDVLELLGALELRLFAACSERKDVLANAEAALKGLEGAAREGDVAAALKYRQEFYRALLSSVGRYVAAQFETLLPTSRRIMFRLINHTGLDLFDISRFYTALHQALLAGCRERVTELSSACNRRMLGLASDHFGDRSYSVRKARAIA